MSWINVTYRICAARDQLDTRARALALEQSVEVSAEVVTDPFVAANIMGRVAAIHPADGGPHKVVIRLATATTGFDVAQTVNMLFGNSSLHAHVELVDVAQHDLVHVPSLKWHQFRAATMNRSDSGAW